jgi:phage I-like protein
MTHQAQAQISGLTQAFLGAKLPRGESGAPEWVTVFPRLGAFSTRDGRSYIADGAALLAAFAADAIDVPVDVMHQTDTAMTTGGRADAVGWIVELRVRGDALEARVDWNDEGRALLAAKKYRYVSPSFYHDAQGRAQRLKALSLVNAPAIAAQPALASAQNQNQPEPPMKDIAAVLGLNAEASEAACLAALNARLAASVPKDVHDAALASLAAAKSELDAVKAADRKAKVEALIEGALSAKKIMPAEKDHFVALCATDDGFAAVAKLIETKPAFLAASGLDQRPAPQAGEALDPVLLAAQANKLVADGGASDIAEAVTLLTSKKAA